MTQDGCRTGRSSCLITSAALTEKTKLRKHFGRFDIFFFLICTIIGVDTLGQVAVKGAQGFLWLIFLAIFFFVPYALIVAELGSAFTEESGAYIWTRMAWGRLVAGINAIFYWFSNPVWAFSYRMAAPKRLGMAGHVCQGCRESSCGAYPGGTCGILRSPSCGKKVRQTASVSQAGSPSGATLSVWSCCSPSGHSQSPRMRTGSDHSSRRLQLPSSRLGSHSPTNCAKRPGGAATIWRMRGLSCSLTLPPSAGSCGAARPRGSGSESSPGRIRQAPDRRHTSGTGCAPARPFASPGSHGGWEPVAVAESWDGGVGACNNYAYSFEGIALATTPGVGWHPFTRGYVLQDPGYRIVRRGRMCFLATSRS